VEKAYDSVMTEGGSIVHKHLIHSRSMKLVRLIKIYLTDTYSKILTEVHLYDTFPAHRGNDISRILFNFALEYSIMKREKKTRRE